MKVLLHCCCAPCSLSCIPSLKEDGIDVTAFWYNPNIHPFKEYETRRDCLIGYTNEICLPLLIKEEYGLVDFCKAVIGNVNNRCAYCYECRLEETAKFARDNEFEYFTTTLLASLYQDHEAIKAAGERYALKYGVKFLYRDFRPNFRNGNAMAREKEFYMQKYCGCIFSEMDRYKKQIDRDKLKYNG